MPLFGKKKNKDGLPQPDSSQTDAEKMDAASRVNGSNGANPETEPPPAQVRPKLMFHCQLAHGSPTGIISGFTNVRELYAKIAECYDLASTQIIFCTLNTHKVDMGRLLGGQIGLDDFIFAHVKGRNKEIELTKTDESLGLTITDNGAGYAFIKRIKEGSVIDKAPHINVGDLIEKIDGENMVGKRHFDVAKALKAIPVGQAFVLRVNEPEKSGFSHIAAPSGGGKKSGSYGTGKETLRLRSDGPATVEVEDEKDGLAVDKINGQLESFMGINDTELAQSIWDLGKKSSNPSEFALAIDESELGQFGFTDDFVFDLWGVVSDAKAGRLKKVQEFSEQF